MVRTWEPLNWEYRRYRRSWQSVSDNPRDRGVKGQGIFCVLGSRKAHWDLGKNCVLWVGIRARL